jgi:hypothetical protein
MREIAANLASGASEAFFSFTEYEAMLIFRRLGEDVEITEVTTIYNAESVQVPTKCVGGPATVGMSALLDALRGFAPRVVADLRDTYPDFAANPVANKLVSELLHA